MYKLKKKKILNRVFNLFYHYYFNFNFLGVHVKVFIKLFLIINKAYIFHAYIV
jgi:hypothetical protein